MFLPLGTKYKRFILERQILNRIKIWNVCKNLWWNLYISRNILFQLGLIVYLKYVPNIVYLKYVPDIVNLKYVPNIVYRKYVPDIVYLKYVPNIVYLKYV